MKKKSISKDRLRLITEILFLAVFFLLFRNNRMQNWIMIFGLGVLISLVLGRLYCAWVCPIAALLRPINWLYKKTGIKRLKTPAFMKSEWVRWVLLIIFAAVMIITKKFQIKFNLILYLTALAVFISLIFEENFWHRYLCPYGALLSIFSRPARYGVKIDEAICSGCGRCQKVCPGDCITVLDNKKRQIDSNNCLVCFKCEEVCPENAIRYSKEQLTLKSNI